MSLDHLKDEHDQECLGKYLRTFYRQIHDVTIPKSDLMKVYNHADYFNDVDACQYLEYEIKKRLSEQSNSYNVIDYFENGKLKFGEEIGEHLIIYRSVV